MYKLKSIPEDFVVREVADRTFLEDGDFLIVKVKKKLWNSEDVACALAKKLGVPRRNIKYAGVKDRVGVTEQFFSLKNVDAERVAKVDLKNVSFEVIGYSNEPLHLGALKGNEFEIVLRNLSNEEIKECNFVPNFYDSQRFGSNNAVVGKHIVLKEFKEACGLLSNQDSYEGRQLMSILKQQPHNYIGALRSVRKKILSLYVRSYQSLLFNKMLESMLKKKSLEELQDVDIDLVGFGSEGLSDEYMALLEEEGVSLRSFVVREFSYVSLEGNKRSAVVKIENLKIGSKEEDDLHEGMYKQKVSFFLQKGSYATNVVKYIVKDKESVK